MILKRKTLDPPPGETILDIEPDVLDALYSYNSALLRMVGNGLEEDFISSYARFHEKGLRVAALLASLANQKTICIEHWHRAQQITEIWRHSLHRAYAQINEVTSDPAVTLEQRILDVVSRLRNPSVSKLLTFVGQGYSRVHVIETAEKLAQIGQLQVVEKTWGSRLIRRYIIPGSLNEAA